MQKTGLLFAGVIVAVGLVVVMTLLRGGTSAPAAEAPAGPLD